MPEMVPFRFADFYDVPRTIAVRYCDRLLLLQSTFDAELDEYPEHYSVYLLPDQVEESLQRSSWTFLENIPLASIGSIPIEAIQFDYTTGPKLDPSVFDDLIDPG